MITNLDSQLLKSYVCHQLNNIFPDSNLEHNLSMLDPKYMRIALERLERCFSAIKLKYYHQEGTAYFDHLNSDHYAMFLYLLANTVYKNHGPKELCTKLFYLNKVLHGVDAFYSINLPEIFLFVHPVGTILGNAVYDDYFIVYQNCTIGANQQGIYPVFSKGTVLYSKASVIGNCVIGSNVVFGANSLLIDTNIESNKLVVGSYPNHRVLTNSIDTKNNLFENNQINEMQI